MNYRVNYTAKWTQVYTAWVNEVENIIEARLETGDFKEANDVINKIKAMR